MNVFSTAHRKRTTAFVVLLLWMFSVAAGIVNACVLDGPYAAAGHVGEASARATGTPSWVTSHSGAILGLGVDSDRSEAPCLKVCENSSQALPKLQSGIGHDVLAQMPPPPPVSWSVAAQVVLTADWVDRMPPATRAVPIRIRLARLAL